MYFDSVEGYEDLGYEGGKIKFAGQAQWYF